MGNVLLQLKMLALFSKKGNFFFSKYFYFFPFLLFPAMKTAQDADYTQVCWISGLGQGRVTTFRIVLFIPGGCWLSQVKLMSIFCSLILALVVSDENIFSDSPQNRFICGVRPYHAVEACLGDGTLFYPLLFDVCVICSKMYNFLGFTFTSRAGI